MPRDSLGLRGCDGSAAGPVTGSDVWPLSLNRAATSGVLCPRSYFPTRSLPPWVVGTWDSSPVLDGAKPPTAHKIFSLSVAIGRCGQHPQLLRGSLGPAPPPHPFGGATFRSERFFSDQSGMALPHRKNRLWTHSRSRTTSLACRRWSHVPTATAPRKLGVPLWIIQGFQGFADFSPFPSAWASARSGGRPKSRNPWTPWFSALSPPRASYSQNAGNQAPARIPGMSRCPI